MSKFFNEEKWEFSDVEKEEIERIPPEEGDRWLKIIGAKYEADSKEYNLTMQDLGNSAIFTLRYWLNSADKTTGDIIPNVYHRNALIGLGKALAGENCGIPKPSSIIGGVVLGTVTLKESAKGNKFPRVFVYKPVPYDMAEGFSDLKDEEGNLRQYYEGAELVGDEFAEE